MQQEGHGSARPEVIQETHDTLRAQLIRRGFEPAAGTNADFLVGFPVSFRETTAPIEPDTNQFAWWTLESWWGGQGSRGSANVREFSEGQLAIEIFDARTQKAIWQGWVRKELTPTDLADSERPIRRAVTTVLKSFPPQTHQ